MKEAIATVITVAVFFPMALSPHVVLFFVIGLAVLGMVVGLVVAFRQPVETVREAQRRQNAPHDIQSGGGFR